MTSPSLAAGRCGKLNRAMDRVEQLWIVAAAAQMSVHRLEDLAIGWIGMMPQQANRRHDHARRAVSALKLPLGDKRLLHRVQRLAICQALDGGDRFAISVLPRRRAAENPFA